MKKSEFIKTLKETLSEVTTTNVGGASFKVGEGEQYGTPKAFGKSSRAKKASTSMGFKEVHRPKHPSHTKGFDYL